MAILVWAASFAACLLVFCLLDRNSLLRAWMWCRRHNLFLDIEKYDDGICWHGLDGVGIRWVPDKDGTPVRCLNERRRLHLL